MEITPFEKFILENLLYNLWKEYGTSEAKTFEALIEEYDFKKKYQKANEKTCLDRAR